MIFTYVIEYRREGRGEVKRHQNAYEEWDLECNDHYILDMLMIIKKRLR